MKVLFLDIDGVLNCTRTALAFGGYPYQLEHQGAFDQVAISMIRALCRASECSVVLSSAWRMGNEPHAVAAAFDLPVMDRTPSLPGNRGSEIQHWLDRHPEVQVYAIVDDDSDMLDSQMPYFVKTDGHNGLLWGDYLRLCEILGADPHEGRPRERDWRTAAPKLTWEAA